MTFYNMKFDFLQRCTTASDESLKVKMGGGSAWGKANAKVQTEVLIAPAEARQDQRLPSHQQGECT